MPKKAAPIGAAAMVVEAPSMPLKGAAMPQKGATLPLGATMLEVRTCTRAAFFGIAAVENAMAGEKSGNVATRSGIDATQSGTRGAFRAVDAAFWGNGGTFPWQSVIAV
jgi:hypothetical protein